MLFDGFEQYSEFAPFASASRPPLGVALLAQPSGGQNGWPYLNHPASHGFVFWKSFVEAQIFASVRKFIGK